MLPSSGRGELSAIWEESEYVPRTDQNLPILPSVPKDDSLGPPATAETRDKAFAQSNALTGIGDDVSNRTSKLSYRGSYDSSETIIPKTNLPFGLASIEENWSQNISKKEQLGSFTDRLGRQIPIEFDAMPQRQFDAPKPTQGGKKMEFYTGTTFQKKKEETVNSVPDAEIMARTKALSATAELSFREQRQMGSNKSHTQGFAEYEDCREGYRGWNLTDGHDKRAEYLPDTARNHYKSFKQSKKGIDLDALCVNPKKTTKVETKTFERKANLGNGAFEACSIEAPIDLEAEVIYDGRTGNMNMDIMQSCNRTDANRTVRQENGPFSHKNEGKFKESAQCYVRSEKKVSARIASIENNVGGNEEKVGCSKASNGATVPSLQLRGNDMTLFEGQVATSIEGCKIHAGRDQNEQEEEQELVHIFNEQQVENASCRPEHILGDDKSVNVIDIVTSFLQKEASCGHVRTGNVPSNRLPENKGNTGNTNISHLECPILPDAVPSMLQNELVPRENDGIDATAIACFVNPNIVLGNQDAKMLNMGQVGSAPHVHNTNCHPQQTPSNGVGELTKPHLGFAGNVWEFCKNIMPVSQPKSQLTSGKEIGFVSNRASHVECAANRGEELLSEEKVRNGRFGVAGTVLNECVPHNITVKSDKRGLVTHDRLSNQGLVNVERDRRIVSCEKNKEYKNRGESYRSPSVMSTSSDSCKLVRPESQMKQERSVSVTPRC